MTGGFQIWSQNSNRITFDPLFGKKKNGWSQGKFQNSQDFSRFQPSFVFVFGRRKSVCLVRAHHMLCNKVKFLNWPFEVMWHTFDSCRWEKHDDENGFALTLKRTKLFVKKTILLKNNIFELCDLALKPKPSNLGEIWRQYCDGEFLWLSSVFFGFSLIS